MALELSWVAERRWSLVAVKGSGEIARGLAREGATVLRARQGLLDSRGDS